MLQRLSTLAIILDSLYIPPMQMTKQQKSNARAVFDLWELLVFEKIKRYGKIDEVMREAILNDLSCYTVSRKIGIPFLEDQIKDMIEQIAEQRGVGEHAGIIESP